MSKEPIDFTEELKVRKRVTGYLIINRPVLLYYENIEGYKLQEFVSDHPEDGTKSLLSIKLKDGLMRMVCVDEEESMLAAADIEDIIASQKLKPVAEVVPFNRNKPV